MEMTPRQAIIGTVILLSIVFGVKLLWAKIIYGDLKCAVAECRITK